MLQEYNLKRLVEILKKDIKLTEDDENILQDLFELRLNIINKCLNKNKNYYNTLINTYKIYDQIEKSINDENLINLIEEWMCLTNEANASSNEIHYKLGIKDGINIIISALEEIDEKE